MKTSPKIRFTPSSGNVYADIGVPDAEDMLVKADLAYKLVSMIRANNWTLAEVAKTLGIPESDLSGLLGGKLRGITSQELAAYLILAEGY